MSTKKKMSPGDTVKIRCISCGDPREHKVISILDETTFRVECTSCDSEQDYEKVASKPRAKKASTSTVPKPSRAKVDPVVAEQKEWVQIRPDMNIEKAVVYDMDGSYKTKTIVRHSAFGFGLVTRVAGPRKVEVLFESGKKLLRCH